MVLKGEERLELLKMTERLKVILIGLGVAPNFEETAKIARRCQDRGQKLDPQEHWWDLGMW